MKFQRDDIRRSDETGERGKREKETERAYQRRSSSISSICRISLLSIIGIGRNILAVASIPTNIWNTLPRWIMDTLAYPDYRQVVSQGLVEVPIGVFISSFIWKVLGDRKQNIIGESEAMMKFYHLKLTERDKKQFIINWNTKQGYPLPFYLQGVAREGIIQETKDWEIKDVAWNKQDPKPSELGL